MGYLLSGQSNPAPPCCQRDQHYPVRRRNVVVKPSVIFEEIGTDTQYIHVPKPQSANGHFEERKSFTSSPKLDSVKEGVLVFDCPHTNGQVYKDI